MVSAAEIAKQGHMCLNPESSGLLISFVKARVTNIHTVDTQRKGSKTTAEFLKPHSKGGYSGLVSKLLNCSAKVGFFFK